MRSGVRIKNINIKLIALLSMLVFFAVNFNFARAQEIGVPENLEQAREVGEHAFETAKNQLPDAIKKAWEEQVLPFWQKMYGWFDENISPKIREIFKKEVQPRIESEIEARKEIVGQSLEEKIRETKKDLPGFLQGIWQFLGDAILKLQILWQ